MYRFPDGTTCPIMHVLSSFNKFEKNYEQIQKEVYTLKFAVKKFHPYIYERKFKLVNGKSPVTLRLDSADIWLHDETHF